MTKIAVLVTLSAALTVSSAGSAQIAPGIVPPDTARTAMVMAQMMGCTFAALGRPSPVSSKAGYREGGLDYQAHPPETMLSAASLPRKGTLAFTLKNPEGPVWVFNNQKLRRCAVATTAGDLAAAESLFVGDYARGMMGYRELKSAQAGRRTYKSRQLGLTTFLKSSTRAADPFVVVTEKTR